MTNTKKMPFGIRVKIAVEQAEAATLSTEDDPDRIIELLDDFGRLPVFDNREGKKKNPEEWVLFHLQRLQKNTWIDDDFLENHSAIDDFCGLSGCRRCSVSQALAMVYASLRGVLDIDCQATDPCAVSIAKEKNPPFIYGGWADDFDERDYITEYVDDILLHFHDKKIKNRIITEDQPPQDGPKTLYKKHPILRANYQEFLKVCYGQWNFKEWHDAKTKEKVLDIMVEQHKHIKYGALGEVIIPVMNALDKPWELYEPYDEYYLKMQGLWRFFFGMFVVPLSRYYYEKEVQAHQQ